MLETQLSAEVIRNMTGDGRRRFNDAVCQGLFVAEYYANEQELVESIIGHLNSMGLILEETAYEKTAAARCAEAQKKKP